MTTLLDLDTVAQHYVRALEDGADGLADWWAMRLDAADAERRARLEQPDLLAESAAYLASRGLHVFPLTHPNETAAALWELLTAVRHAPAGS